MIEDSRPKSLGKNSEYREEVIQEMRDFQPKRDARNIPGIRVLIKRTLQNMFIDANPRDRSLK